MIEELVSDGESELDNKGLDDPYVPEDTLTRASYVIGCPTVISNRKQKGVLKWTYVYHGSTIMIP